SLQATCSDLGGIVVRVFDRRILSRPCRRPSGLRGRRSSLACPYPVHSTRSLPGTLVFYFPILGINHLVTLPRGLCSGWWGSLLRFLITRLRGHLLIDLRSELLKSSAQLVASTLDLVRFLSR